MLIIHSNFNAISCCWLFSSSNIYSSTDLLISRRKTVSILSFVARIFNKLVAIQLRWWRYILQFQRSILFYPLYQFEVRINGKHFTLWWKCCLLVLHWLVSRCNIHDKNVQAINEIFFTNMKLVVQINVGATCCDLTKRKRPGISCICVGIENSIYYDVWCHRFIIICNPCFLCMSLFCCNFQVFSLIRSAGCQTHL
jgi:hypothetical protein